MKIILCGGGTSGHVTPSLAIAEAFKRRLPECEFLFIGRRGGKENDAVNDAGLPVNEIDIRGLRHFLSIENAAILREAIKARRKAKSIISDFSPDAVIGTGGYVCWPVISAAQKMNIPTFIHESNAAAGLTTRILSKGCRAVFAGVKELENEFPNGIYTGNPLRRNFINKSRTSARKEMKISDDRRLIISVGGSLGAEKLNDAAIALMNNFSLKNKNIVHIHICGHRYYEDIKRRYPELCSLNSQVRIIPFSNDMPTLLHAADLVIARCGAMTISEIECCRVPAVLIPSPNVASDHQRKNAYAYAKDEATVVIEEKELTGDSLIAEVRKMLSADYRVNWIKNTAKNRYFCDAGDVIVEKVIEIIK